MCCFDFHQLILVMGETANLNLLVNMLTMHGRSVVKGNVLFLCILLGFKGTTGDQSLIIKHCFVTVLTNALHAQYGCVTDFKIV